MISYKKVFHGFIWFLFLSFLVLYFAQAGGWDAFGGAGL